MAEKPDEAKKVFWQVLALLNHVHHVADQKCDEIANQFDKFVDTILPPLRSQFIAFDKSKDYMDTLLFTHLSSKKGFESLWSVILKLPLLSHGQATVERGFSINQRIWRIWLESRI